MSFLLSARDLIPDSVVTQYRFEDDSDTSTAIDSIGSNNATISGPTYTTDAAKGSLAIESAGTDNSGDLVESNSTVDLVSDGPTEEFSVGGFIKSDGAQDFRYSVSAGADGENALSLYTGSGDTWIARLEVGGSVELADSGVAISTSDYQSVFAVADQSEVGIIVDGTLEATTAHSFDITQIGQMSLKAIQGHTSPNNIFDGSVDDATYANDRLTESDAQALIDR